MVKRLCIAALSGLGLFVYNSSYSYAWGWQEEEVKEETYKYNYAGLLKNVVSGASVIIALPQQTEAMPDLFSLSFYMLLALFVVICLKELIMFYFEINDKYRNLLTLIIPIVSSLISTIINGMKEEESSKVCFQMCYLVVSTFYAMHFIVNAFVKLTTDEEKDDQ